MEANFTKIAKKITENHGDPTRVGDLLRGSIYVQSYDEMMTAYNEIYNSKHFELVQVVNEIDKYIKRVTLYLIFMKGIIVEIKLKYGVHQVDREANNKLFYLSNCKTSQVFIHELYTEIGKYAEKENLYSL